MLKTVIVEDDRMVANINAQFAEKTPGVQVVAIFHSGRDALAFLEKTRVDILLTDLYMPEMSGIELVTGAVTQMSSSSQPQTMHRISRMPCASVPSTTSSSRSVTSASRKRWIRSSCAVRSSRAVSSSHRPTSTR